MLYLIIFMLSIGPGCEMFEPHFPPPGHHDEALAVAERGRTRAFADLLVERQTGQQDSDPYCPVTVEHILDTVNGQRSLVLYFSLAAGYLYSWLLAPGAGEGRTGAASPERELLHQGLSTQRGL